MAQHGDGPTSCIGNRPGSVTSPDCDTTRGLTYIVITIGHTRDAGRGPEKRECEYVSMHTRMPRACEWDQLDTFIHRDSTSLNKESTAWRQGQCMPVLDRLVPSPMAHDKRTLDQRPHDPSPAPSNTLRLPMSIRFFDQYVPGLYARGNAPARDTFQRDPPIFDRIFARPRLFKA